MILWLIRIFSSYQALWLPKLVREMIFVIKKLVFYGHLFSSLFEENKKTTCKKYQFICYYIFWYETAWHQ